MESFTRGVKLSGRFTVSLFLHAADTSFEQIVRDHQTMVFSTLIRLTGSREHVDDLAQEVFLRLYRALPAFRGEALLSTYLYRIIANVAQDEWKRRRRDDRPLVSFSEEESDWEERSYEQIALSLKLPIGTVRTHLHRGRKKLRQGIQRQQEMERGTAWQKTR